MKHSYCKKWVPLLTALALTGCIDDNYDLDDIDTTSQIKVNNLVVPVNLDTIELDQVLDIDEDDTDGIITKFTDASGKTFYAISKGDSFNPDPVYIDMFSAEAPMIPEISLLSPDSQKEMPRRIGNFTTNFRYSVDKVDKAINSINSINLATPMEITLEITSDVKDLYIDNLIILLTEDFEILYEGLPSPAGMIDVGRIYANQPVSKISVTAIKTDNGKVDHTSTPNFMFEGYIGVASGEIVSPSNQEINNLNIKFTLGNITANKIAGNISYNLDIPEIPSVDLSNLPDFLTEGSSDLILANPQLYITFNNPIGVSCRSSLSIQPVREEMISNDYATDFSLNVSSPGEYTMLLAPDEQKANLPYFQFTRFNDLANVLSGTGVPQSLNISLDNSLLYGDCEVELGKDIPFYGDYRFFAPLALSPKGFIHYVKTQSDWFSKDIDTMDIDLLKLTANASSTLPVDVELFVYPLKKDGTPAGNPAHTLLKAETANQNFFVELSGVKNLDGVRFEALVTTQSEEYLTPQQTIKLENIRATVSGRYITDF